MRQWLVAGSAGSLLLLAFGAARGGQPGWPRAAEHSGSGELRLEVDISDRRLRVRHGGTVTRTFRIAVGDAEHPTPRGTFTIDLIVWNPDWTPPDEAWARDEARRAADDPENPMVGAKLFFRYPDYYIHGTNAPGTLGSAASHGCIRMAPSSVLQLARLVQAHGGAARSAEWYESAARNDATPETVRLSRGIGIIIRD